MQLPNAFHTCGYHAFMRGWAVLIPAVGFALAGCGSPPDQIIKSEPIQQVQKPSLSRSTSIFLLTPSKDSRLHVGDSPTDASRDFPEPPGAFPFRELPPGFEANYRASGFNAEGGISFGAIYYNDNGDQIAEAMTHEGGLSEADVDQTESDYATAFDKDPTQTIPGRKVRYWFWQDKDNKQTFMLCAVASQEKGQSGRYELTAAVGDDVVMKALRMDYADAVQDQRALEPNEKMRKPRQTDLGTQTTPQAGSTAGNIFHEYNGADFVAPSTAGHNGIDPNER